MSGFEQAERRQRLSGTPLLVYFFTDWCPYCRELENDLLSSFDVELRLRETVIRVRVNPEASDADRRLTERFGVAGFPRLYLVFPDGDNRRLSTRIRDGEGSRLEEGADFVKQIDQHVAQYVRRRLNAASERRRGGDPTAAIDMLDAIAALRPEDPEIYFQRAVAYAERGDGDRAVEDLRRTHELAPDEIRVFQQADVMLTKEDRWHEIAACWSVFIARHPENIPARLERADALARAGDGEGARRDMQDACRFGEPRACDFIARLGG